MILKKKELIALNNHQLHQQIDSHEENKTKKSNAAIFKNYQNIFDNTGK